MADGGGAQVSYTMEESLNARINQLEARHMRDRNEIEQLHSALESKDAEINVMRAELCVRGAIISSPLASTPSPFPRHVLSGGPGGGEKSKQCSCVEFE